MENAPGDSFSPGAIALQAYFAVLFRLFDIYLNI